MGPAGQPGVPQGQNQMVGQPPQQQMNNNQNAGYEISLPAAIDLS